MKRSILVLCVISFLVGVGLAGWIVDRFPALRLKSAGAVEPRATEVASRETLPASQRAAPPVPLTPEEEANIYVYEQADRSVVNITTESVRHDAFLMLEQHAKGSGSGTIIDKKGHILTNYHVVEGAQQIEVLLASGNSYAAELVGRDKKDDIAVLQIDAPADELHPVVWGDSSKLKVGQRAYAIGSPFGWDRTLTTGIISSLNRALPSRRRHRLMDTLIQTDAAMNPGNSGGPLLDTSARMIGMSVAIATKTGQNAGVGFAIPVNRIKRMVPELIAHGKFTRADIGIESVGETPRGLLIVKLATGGPAERAGLQGYKVIVRRYQRGFAQYEERQVDRSAADMILAIDGQPIRDVEQFLEIVESHKPGDQVTLTVRRQDGRVELPVTLGAS